MYVYAGVQNHPEPRVRTIFSRLVKHGKTILQRVNFTYYMPRYKIVVCSDFGADL